MRVQFCGVRGSTPAPGVEFLRYGGHTSCVAISHDDADVPSLILDSGTGIRAVTKLLAHKPFIGTILLTHLHWDHVQGLPFFSAADRDDARVRLLLPEQEGGAEVVVTLERAMSPPHFPMGPGGLRGLWTFAAVTQGQVQIEGFTVLAREIPHKGGRTFGYRVSDGHSSLAYMPDHCPTSLGPGPDSCGEYHPAALELASGVDVLIHDAQLRPEDLEAEGRFGHATYEYAIELGRHAKARTVALFHHRPDRTDDELDELARALEPFGAIVAAQDTQLNL